MNSNLSARFLHFFYLLFFFGFLFFPLIVMGLSAFNTSSFPQISPWEGFTLRWFVELANDSRLMKGLSNSLVIGFGVISLALPMGLSGALFLQHLGKKARSAFFTLMITPILVPGIILGISTLIFWDGVHMLIYGDPFEISPLNNGIFLTILGQTTFIASYSMLVFIARLQRFEATQEEAAADLGATQIQFFFKVLVPYLKPSIFSAAVLAFLTSFENYNTTVFTIYEKNTLTTELAGKVRLGITPSISALAVLILGLTLFAAVMTEIFKRREAK